MIKIIEISKIEESQYIKPFRVKYEKNSKEMCWDCIKVHDSVSILLYHKQKDSFLLVKQVRIPLVIRDQDLDLSEGITYELCAGIMDKGFSEEDTIAEEIEEEVGYKATNIEKIATFYGSLGTSAAKQTIFYAEISDEMKISDGGGTDGEDIELYYLPVAKAKEFIDDETFVKPANLGYAILWWFGKFRS